MIGTPVKYTEDNGVTWKAAVVLAGSVTAADLAVWKAGDKNGAIANATTQLTVSDTGPRRYEAV